MGVDIKSEGDVVFIRIESPIEERDAVAWAERVMSVAKLGCGRVHLVAEFALDVRIPLDVFLAACRKALDLADVIASLAYVAHGPAERTLTRAAATVIAAAYPVGHFHDVGSASAWVAGQAAGVRASPGQITGAAPTMDAGRLAQ